MSRSFKIISLALIIILIFFAFLQLSNRKQTPLSAGTEVVSIGQNTISAEIADTPAKRTLGLGDRASLPADHGMLFVFDHADRYGFWMKDTYFPLDLIWIDSDKTIITIKNSIATSTYPEVFYPQTPALYVLELNAGYVENHHIEIGQKINLSENQTKKGIFSGLFFQPRLHLKISISRYGNCLPDPVFLLFFHVRLSKTLLKLISIIFCY